MDLSLCGAVCVRGRACWGMGGWLKVEATTHNNVSDTVEHLTTTRHYHDNMMQLASCDSQAVTTRLAACCPSSQMKTTDDW